MDEGTRFCSACGAQMQLRLGQFECPACGRTEAQQQPAQGPARSSQSSASSGYDPGAQYRTQPPPQEALPPPQPGGGYGYGAARPGYGAAPSSGDDPLRMEKFIYLGLMTVYMIGIAAFMPQLKQMMLAAAPHTAGGPDPTALITGMMSGMVVGGFIGISVNALVLFLREVWLKWTCLGCNGCSALVAVFGMFGGAAFARGGHPLLNGFSALIGFWYISILYRDIQNVQQGS